MKHLGKENAEGKKRERKKKRERGEKKACNFLFLETENK